LTKKLEEVEKFNSNLICPLCGKKTAQHNGKKYISCEDIPPKCVFIDRNDKRGLIKVPSCDGCNNKTSAQDEKFKYQLSLLLGLDTDQKKQFWNSCRKTLKSKPVWREAVLKNTSSLLMPYGKGHGHPVKMDVLPVRTVVTKIIRGLHWYLTGEIIPPDVKPSIRILEQGCSLDGNLLAMFNKFGKSIQKCENQFEAIYALAEDCKYGSAWLLRFYGQDCFLAFLRSSKKEPKRILLNKSEPVRKVAIF